MRDCPQTPGWGATCGTFGLVLLVFRVREFERANGLMEPTRSCNRCLRGTAELDWVVDFEPESHIRRDLQSTLRPMPRSQLGRMRLNAIPFLGNEHNDVASSCWAYGLSFRGGYFGRWSRLRLRREPAPPRRYVRPWRRSFPSCRCHDPKVTGNFWKRPRQSFGRVGQPATVQTIRPEFEE
jgi:hypothetical protein